ncbi:MAG: hypothetical protein A3E83_01050 [Gammaproteobacteria bacterium RIFCSPHIGHO2_12_FULL_41_20]|nr:MAG: hypothetical protein A3E83_01050 [Gammaproteobacteria bacterium RIFCSPHIGHO2_12_FULL_41_20]
MLNRWFSRWRKVTSPYTTPAEHTPEACFSAALRAFAAICPMQSQALVSDFLLLVARFERQRLPKLSQRQPSRFAIIKEYYEAAGALGSQVAQQEWEGVRDSKFSAAFKALSRIQGSAERSEPFPSINNLEDYWRDQLENYVIQLTVLFPKQAPQLIANLLYTMGNARQDNVEASVFMAAAADLRHTRAQMWIKRQQNDGSYHVQWFNCRI